MNIRSLTTSLILFSLLLFAPTLRAAETVDRLEASVNSSLILLSDVEKFRSIIGLRSQLDPLFNGTPIASAGAKASNSEVIRFLIDEQIIEQEFKISDTEVEQEINQIQSANQIDRSSLKNTLREQGYEFDDYFELIRASTAKRNLIDRDIRAKVTISDDDIKNYYYNHYAKASTAQLTYKIQMITISPENYKTPAAAKDIADRALKDLKGGEPFEDVAKRVSDDPSAATGGDLGTFTEDQMSPFIREHMKKLQIGEISAPITAPGGRLVILKLVDITSSESERFNKMKDEIRNHLAAAEYQHQISLWLDRQRQNAFIHLAAPAK